MVDLSCQSSNKGSESASGVPGSPEQVWRAIATGDGISAWFVPSQVEERVGGAVVASFGPGMDSVTKITAWNPPHSYTSESGEGAATVATEWTVEAKGGGSCVVRVVHRWFADSDDWDGEYEGHAYGWATSYFRMLWLHLSHFPGQRCEPVQLTAFSALAAPGTWRAIKDALGIDEQTSRFRSVPGIPELRGTVDQLQIDDPELLRIQTTSPQVAAALDGMDGEYPELLLQLEGPAPGLAHVFVSAMGDQALVSMRFHLYGEAGAAAAAEVQRAWSDWLARTFPDAQPA